jgi:hypothetical protein
MTTILKFTQFNSAVDASFWQSLVLKKLDVLQLSKEHLNVNGQYTFGTLALNEEKQEISLPSRFSIPADGLDE